MKKILSLAFAALVIGGCSTVGSTPEPKWQSVRKDGAIEIRRYDPMIVAEVTTSGERYAAINDGFRILADYIFGNNIAQKDIAMTAPVTQQADSGAKIAMTAPVTQQAGQENTWKVRFVMPAEYTKETLPKPQDARISLIEIPAHQVAVIRFSGFNTDKNLAAHEKKLLDWLSVQKMKAQGSPTYAFYNPPWTPPFLKRNEVMVGIRD